MPTCSFPDTIGLSLDRHAPGCSYFRMGLVLLVPDLLVSADSTPLAEIMPPKSETSTPLSSIFPQAKKARRATPTCYSGFDKGVHEQGRSDQPVLAEQVGCAHS